MVHATMVSKVAKHDPLGTLVRLKNSILNFGMLYSLNVVVRYQKNRMPFLPLFFRPILTKKKGAQLGLPEYVQYIHKPKH